MDIIFINSILLLRIIYQELYIVSKNQKLLFRKSYIKKKYFFNLKRIGMALSMSFNNLEEYWSKIIGNRDIVHIMEFKTIFLKYINHNNSLANDYINSFIDFILKGSPEFFITKNIYLEAINKFKRNYNSFTSEGFDFPENNIDLDGRRMASIFHTNYIVSKLPGFIKSHKSPSYIPPCHYIIRYTSSVDSIYTIEYNNFYNKKYKYHIYVDTKGKYYIHDTYKLYDIVKIINDFVASEGTCEKLVY